ncbi:hypothetical protein LXL04_001706 [Taraxacum kok-saghyz]
MQLKWGLSRSFWWCAFVRIGAPALVVSLWHRLEQREEKSERLATTRWSSVTPETRNQRGRWRMWVMDSERTHEWKGRPTMVDSSRQNSGA